MEGVSVSFPSMGPMRGQNVLFLFSKSRNDFYVVSSTEGRDRAYPTKKFPVSVRTSRIVINSPEMFPKWSSGVHPKMSPVRQLIWPP